MFPIARNCLVRGRKLTSRNVRSFQKCWAPHSLMGGKHSEDSANSRSRTTGFLSMLIGIEKGLTSLLVLWPLRYRTGSRLLRSAEQTPPRARVNRPSPPYWQSVASKIPGAQRLGRLNTPARGRLRPPPEYPHVQSVADVEE